MFRGTFHIILGSGLTIAGATFCLHLARLSYLQGTWHSVRAGADRRRRGSTDRGAGVVAVATRFGLLDRRQIDQDARVAAHRHRYSALARYGVRGLAGTLRSIGILIMRSIKISYNDRFYIPREPAVECRVERQSATYSAATMNPDILMMEE